MGNGIGLSMRLMHLLLLLINLGVHFKIANYMKYFWKKNQNCQGIKNQLARTGTSASNVDSVAGNGLSLLLLTVRKQNKTWEITVFRYWPTGSEKLWSLIAGKLIMSVLQLSWQEAFCKSQFEESKETQQYLANVLSWNLRYNLEFRVVEASRIWGAAC